MENALIFKHILPTSSVRKCMEISLENWYVDIAVSVPVYSFIDFI